MACLRSSSTVIRVASFSSCVMRAAIIGTWSKACAESGHVSRCMISGKGGGGHLCACVYVCVYIYNIHIIYIHRYIHRYLN